MMTTPHAVLWRSIGVLLAAVTASTPVAAQCRYHVTIVQADPCQSLPVPTLALLAINDVGHAAGFVHRCTLLGFRDGVFWSEETGIQVLDSPGGDDGVTVRDINAADEIVGGYFAGIGFQGVVWRNGVPTELPTPIDGVNWACAEAINDDGVIVGFVGDAAHGQPPYRAVLWINDEMVDISARFPAVASFGRDINNLGAVVGSGTGMEGGLGRGFVWSGGRFTYLAVPPGSELDEARKINDRGVIAGRASLPNPKAEGGYDLQPCIWKDGEVTYLLDDGVSGSVTGMNDAGQVIGTIFVPGPDPPFIWQDGVLTILYDVIDNPNITFKAPREINERGQIAAWASGPGPHGSSSLGVILTPIGSSLADLNIDCRVDEADLMVLLEDWGPAPHLPSDLDDDGEVGPRDLALMLAEWTN